MSKNHKVDYKSTLFNYYTLAHAMTPRKNSPTHGKSTESGDETDRSVDNDVIESFFMDEINENTESCSLNSSRENLLDGEPGKECKPNSRPSSRPSSARRGSYKGSELPIDERIKVLEEGLKEKDMECEVVLSCLGKEYLERMTMQTYLQDICSKSGYNYDEIISNIVAQSGGKKILENIMETRAKELLKTKDKSREQSQKPQHSTSSRSVGEKEWNNNTLEDNLKENETVKFVENVKERQLKDILRKFTEAEIEKANSAQKRSHNDAASSHTLDTKGVESPIENRFGESAEYKNIAGDGCRIDSDEDKAGIFIPDQSTSSGSKRSWEPLKKNSSVIDRSGKEQCNETNFERPVLREKQKGDSVTFESADKHIRLIMPEKIDENMLRDKNASMLRSVEFKRLDSPERSLDSIDEGIFMIKSFLQGLQDREQYLIGNSIAADNNAANKPKRKLSLSETGSRDKQTDFMPQRRRSFAEGMSLNRGRSKVANARVESRLFKPTVASRNKEKDKIVRREYDSDTDGGQKGNERTSTSLKRSASDVGQGRKKNAYNSYTSAEEDSSVDGEDRDLSDTNNFQYVYRMSPEMNQREYAKLISILNMLHESKLSWDGETKSLKDKLEEELKLRADLSHDNGVLRKSLEAANHAIKEINSKVQELKLTIVPLRDENSKLRDQNNSLKIKLDSLRKDKILHLQEFQEFKKASQRYEEKLRCLADLYRNGRIKLVVDSNNNLPNEADVSKGGLLELLDIGEHSANEDRGTVNKRSGRNRDNSKRHSFHGFEKIDELAGNAEELLAEKEKLEQENEALKIELKEIRDRMKAETIEDSEKEADLVNRRRGWRMQREESKHRIIREILRTESNQVYGRPYASCTNLTMEDEREDTLESISNSYEANNRESKDEIDSGNTGIRSMKNTRGGITFDISLEKKGGKKGKISWKEESARIQRRLQNCKFEKPVVKEETVMAKDSEMSEKYPTRDTEIQNTHKDSFTSNVEARPAFDFGVFAYKADISKEGLDSSQNKSTSRADSLKEDMNKTQNGQNARDKIHSMEPRMGNDTTRKGSDSLASPQWPLIREKIQSIYKQPVEILEQSLYEKNSEQSYQSNMSMKGSMNEQNVEARRWGAQRRRVNDGGYIGNVEYQFGREERDSENNENMFSNGYDYIKRNVEGNDEIRRKFEDNWQRKSSSEDIKSYEEYRRKLRREELVNAFEISQVNGEIQPRDSRVADQSKNRGSFGTDSHVITMHDERMVEGSNESRIVNGTETKPNRSKENLALKKAEIYRRDQIDVDSREEVAWGQRDNSPWVHVPVVVKNMNGPSYEHTSTPKRHLRKTENGKHSHVEAKTRSKDERLIEETTTNVESAFRRASATSEVTTKRISKGYGRDFVRQSPGTVMYLDEIADSDSGSSSDVAKTVPRRRSSSLRKPRPKSDVFLGSTSGSEGNSYRYDGDFRRNRSLRLPKKTEDDMFSVDINFEGESKDDSTIQMHSRSFTSSNVATREQKMYCQHQQHQQMITKQHGIMGRQRIQSETGTEMTRSSLRRPKSPGGFSCEMCKEMSKKKSNQEKYCWEKYFPIGETTIETIVIKEDYV